jgi:hypothetical protein
MESRDSDPTVMLGLVVVTLITALAVAAIVVILALT